jgi:hypothetical protein
VLQEIHWTSGLGAETVPRIAPGGADVRRHVGLRGSSIMRKRPAPRQNRFRAPPSLRLPLASMDRASFLRLVALWLAAVIALLVIVLAVRWF